MKYKIESDSKANVTTAALSSKSNDKKQAVNESVLSISNHKKSIFSGAKSVDGWAKIIMKQNIIS